MGTQVQSGFATLDGNYGFSEGCFGAGGIDPLTGLCADTGEAPATSLPAGDYLVEVDVPNDTIFGRPLYQVTREEDINVFDGDQFVPQVPPPACAGALHTVDVAGIGAGRPERRAQPQLCRRRRQPSTKASRSRSAT